MANILWLPAARADYRQALAWYQGQSPRAAAGFEAAIEVALQRIADTPEQWPLADDRHRLYILRRYPYSIVYRSAGDDVLIVAVAHSSRDESYWHGRG